MKKNVVLTLSSSIAVFGTVAIAVSCNKNKEENKNIISNVDYEKTDVGNFYNKFELENHGRIAGNISNVSNYDESTYKFRDLQDPNKKSLDSNDIVFKYDLNTTIANDVNNYGSYHAFLWLKEQVKQMNYANLNSSDVITYPELQDVQLQSESKTYKGKTYQNYKMAANENVVNILKEARFETQSSYYETGITIRKNEEFKNQVIENMLNKTGYQSQGFLFHAKDKLRDGKYMANNLGNNLIVSIQPENPGITEENKSQLKDLYIVAHYDSTTSSTNHLSWGATDNATGVASALALLKHYSTTENRAKLGTRLHVIFVDAEELGKYGSIAFVKEFMESKKAASGENEVETNKLLLSAAGMINFDTVAGGDNMYVHSPNSNPAVDVVKGNISSSIRDQINAISRIRAKDKNDIELELEIHPQFEKNSYRAGETGDWSDHMPFYQYANIPIAYVESTNFNVFSKYDQYDGYAQTNNPNAWIDKNGNKINLVPKAKNGSNIVLWDLPEGVNMEDVVIAGDIWHSDLDRYDWVKENVGNKIYKQLDTVVETIKEYLTSVWHISSNQTIELTI